MSNESISDALEDVSLALFFTWGVSMERWSETGMIDREVALYNVLTDRLDHIYLFTYGDDADMEFQEHLEESVTVVPQTKVRSKLLYSFLAPIIHYRTLREVDIVKTNQMLGSWTAVIASVLFRIPLIVRTGFVLSLFYAKRDRPLILRAMAVVLEALSYFAAAGIMTSSPHGYEYVERRYLIRGEHRYVPNYVETDRFRPMQVEKEPDSLCFIGRLDDQKNLFSLFDALVSSEYSLTVVGTGEHEDALRHKAEQGEIDVEFCGNVPNHDLPELLNRYEVFILPSYFEGMPKTLLEAMSCGMPVIGTDVQGINEVVHHEENGLLCNTDPESIRSAIDRMMTDGLLREKLGANARKYVESEFSLDRILDEELSLYKAVIG